MNWMKKNLILLMSVVLKNNKTKEENLIKAHYLKEGKEEDGMKIGKNCYLIILNFLTMGAQYVYSNVLKCFLICFFNL